MCLCGNPRADFFVTAIVGRPLVDCDVMEVGHVECYVCHEHFPDDSNDLLSSALRDEKWQVYSITVGTLFPRVIH